MDCANSLADTYYRLGLIGSADLAAASWLSAAELYQIADDLAKKLASDSGVFVGYDASIAVTAGTAVYELPAAHVFSLAVWLAGCGLRLTSVNDLWALDANWQATTGPAARASLDANAVGSITIYPNPSAGGTLAQILQEYPATIQVGSTLLSLPTPFQDLLTYAMLAGARGKESDYAAPEMAQHYQARVSMYAQIAEHLYGPGQ